MPAPAIARPPAIDENSGMGTSSSISQNSSQPSPFSLLLSSQASSSSRFPSPQNGFSSSIQFSLQAWPIPTPSSPSHSSGPFTSPSPQTGASTGTRLHCSVQ